MAEARAARDMGLTMSQWDALDEYDRAWALALYVADAEIAAARAEERCPACGGPKSECQDADNQHAFVASGARCFRTRAIDDLRNARKGDPDMSSLVVSVVLDPTRKKSATRRGASRG